MLAIQSHVVSGCDPTGSCSNDAGAVKASVLTLSAVLAAAPCKLAYKQQRTSVTTACACTCAMWHMLQVRGQQVRHVPAAAAGIRC